MKSLKKLRYKAYKRVDKTLKLIKNIVIDKRVKEWVEATRKDELRAKRGSSLKD